MWFDIKDPILGKVTHKEYIPLRHILRVKAAKQGAWIKVGTEWIFVSSSADEIVAALEIEQIAATASPIAPIIDPVFVDPAPIIDPQPAAPPGDGIKIVTFTENE